MRTRQPCVYLLASKARGSLYIGVTSDLSTRIWQHQAGLADGFTKQYGIKLLAWYEMHDTMTDAIRREKCLKEWRRLWKIELVETVNPAWKDRSAEIG